MKLKPIYIYVVLLAAAVAVFLLVPTDQPEKSNLLSKEMPQDDIHKDMQNRQGPPNKDNVTGNIKHQMEMMQKRVEENPDDTLIARQYADFLAAAHRSEEAVKLYENILKKDAKRIDILFSLSFIYYNQKNFDKAEEATKKILKNDPDDLRARYNIGAIAQARGNTEKTVEIWTEIAQKYPSTETGKLAKESLQKLNK